MPDESVPSIWMLRCECPGQRADQRPVVLDPVFVALVPPRSRTTPEREDGRLTDDDDTARNSPVSFAEVDVSVANDIGLRSRFPMGHPDDSC